MYTMSILLYLALDSFLNSYKTNLIHKLVGELTTAFTTLADTITNKAKGQNEEKIP